MFPEGYYEHNSPRYLLWIMMFTHIEFHLYVDHLQNMLKCCGEASFI